MSKEKGTGVDGDLLSSQDGKNVIYNHNGQHLEKTVTLVS